MESMAYGSICTPELATIFGAELDPAVRDAFNEDSPPVVDRAAKVRFVRAVLRMRRRRDSYFDPTLFADPAWDMLLELYASYLEQRRIAVSSLCVASNVPATTALRWITKLEQDGLALRKNDPNDGRRSWIELTDEGVVRMTRFFDQPPVGGI
jgi:DNA-binding MarR family transcriptional regulator